MFNCIYTIEIVLELSIGVSCLQYIISVFVIYSFIQNYICTIYVSQFKHNNISDDGTIFYQNDMTEAIEVQVYITNR